MEPRIITGAAFHDARGSLRYNNDFDASEVMRCYIIENLDTEVMRGWQGHKVEQRWFSAVLGSFQIRLIKIDDWNNPSKDLQTLCFTLSAEHMDILHVPKGYASCIQAVEGLSKLLVMADFHLGEIKDEYRFPLGHFDSPC